MRDTVFEKSAHGPTEFLCYFLSLTSQERDELSREIDQKFKRLLIREGVIVSEAHLRGWRQRLRIFVRPHKC